MLGLKFLPSIRDSETIIYARCKSVQYQRNGTCTRCKNPLKLEYLTLPIESLLNPDSDVSKEYLARVIGALLRRLRKRRGISQSQLAIRAAGSITRTHIVELVHFSDCGRELTTRRANEYFRVFWTCTSFGQGLPGSAALC
jgi:hypothetical protein